MIDRLIDRLVPQALRDDLDRGFRARIVAGLSLALIFSSLPAALAAALIYGTSDPRWYLGLLPGLGQFVSLAMLRTGTSHRPAALAQLLVLYGGQFSFVLLDGGLRSASLPWVLALPVLASMTLGRRAGWLGAALAALQLGAVLAADLAGLEFGLPPTTIQHTWGVFGSLTILAVVLTITAQRFEEARRAAVEDTARALDQLRVKHDELLQAHELTQEASRARRDFLARVSHELRTPVQGMLGTTRLLVDRQTGDTAHELAENAHRSARGLLGLLNDLLDVGRLEADQLQLEESLFDPREPLEDAASLLSEAARAEGLLLLSYIGPDVPASLRGDRRRLQQVTLNLLANALRYTDEGHIVLRASLADTDDGPMLRIEVNDSGVGIDLEKTPRTTLLRPFEQAAPFSTRSHGGAGLGLSIAAQHVDMMGGRLDVESELGVGSTFWFTVPAQDATATAASKSLEGMRAVVVGQDARSRSMVATLLRDWGVSARALPPTDGVREQLLSGELDVDVVVLDRHEGDPPSWEPAAIEAASPTTPQVVLAPAALLGDSPPIRGAALMAPPRQAPLRAALNRLATASATSAEQLKAATLTGENRLQALPRGQGRVLVVEDDPVNALIARRFLERLGYEVEHAVDGRSGLHLAETERFDVVLMDCQLPGLSGYDVTESIRAGDGPNQATPILAVTAHALEDERDRCLNSGMNACLPKPYEPEVLAKELRRMMDEP